jgi:DNA-binding HxlR family transcriptional regulator
MYKTKEVMKYLARLLATSLIAGLLAVILFPARFRWSLWLLIFIADCFIEFCLSERRQAEEKLELEAAGQELNIMQLLLQDSDSNSFEELQGRSGAPEKVLRRTLHRLRQRGLVIMVYSIPGDFPKSRYSLTWDGKTQLRTKVQISIA